jgi:hypothetical protein
MRGDQPRARGRLTARGVRYWGITTGALCLLALIATSDRADAPAPLPPNRWELSSAPTARIGDEPFQEVAFSQVTTLLRASDTVIAAHDRAGVHIRMISLSGHQVGRVGGRPSPEREPGVGEFEHIAWAAVSHDTLFFYDEILRRLTTASPEGDVYGARQWTTRASGLARGVPVGRLANGQWVWVERSSRPFAHESRASIVRDTLEVMRAAAGDSAPVKVASVPGPAIWRAQSVGPGDSTAQRFGPRTLIAVRGDEIWIGDNAGNVLVALDSNGRERRRIVLPMTSPKLEEAVIAEARNEELRWTPDRRGTALLTELYQPDRLPEHPPNFTSLLVSADSLLWVELWSPRRRSARHYLVYGRTGEFLAALDTPEGFRITDAGADWVLGVHVTPTDIEGVRMYAVRRR